MTSNSQDTLHFMILFLVAFICMICVKILRTHWAFVYKSSRKVLALNMVPDVPLTMCTVLTQRTRVPATTKTQYILVEILRIDKTLNTKLSVFFLPIYLGEQNYTARQSQAHKLSFWHLLLWLAKAFEVPNSLMHTEHLYTNVFGKCLLSMWFLTCFCPVWLYWHMEHWYFPPPRLTMNWLKSSGLESSP